MPINVTEAEARWVYKNRNKRGIAIFKPIYKFYKQLFAKVIKENTKIETSFKAFKDTSVYERYMLNAAQFSAAKCDSEAKLLQAAVFDKEKAVKPFQEFKKDAEQITNVTQKTWLRVEYESCRRNAVQGELFRGMREDADLYPYWIYVGVMDSREREEHKALEGKVFKIGDKEGDDCFPPNDWNCRCTGEPVDDDYLAERGLKVTAGKDAIEHVDKQFRYNPDVQGTMPNDGSYFNGIASANDLKGSNFEDE